MRQPQSFCSCFAPAPCPTPARRVLPAIRGTDLGIWRRIALVPFEVTFEGDRKDSDLPAKLDAEVEGILAWAVEGCLEWQRDGLHVPERVKAIAMTRSHRPTPPTLDLFSPVAGGPPVKSGHPRHNSPVFTHPRR